MVFPLFCVVGFEDNSDDTTSEINSLIEKLRRMDTANDQFVMNLMNYYQFLIIICYGIYQPTKW